MKLIAEGLWHKVYKVDERVRKIPKNSRTIFEVSSEIQYFMDYFWKYALETVIIWNWDIYMLEQPYFDGEHLSILNIIEVENEFIKLLELHKLSLKENGKWLDLVGLEWWIKWFLHIIRKYKWTHLDSNFITPLLKKLSKKYSYLSKMYFFWENGSIPELANIMINSEGDIKIVDISITEQKEFLWIIRAKVIEAYNKYYLKRFFWIIYQ